MFEIKVSQEIKDACPVFAGAAVYAAVDDDPDKGVLVRWRVLSPKN